MEGYPYEETVKDRRSAACRRNGYGDAHSEKGGAFKGDLRVKGTDPAQEYVTITVTADYRVGQFLTNLLDFIGENIGIKYPGTKVDFNTNSSWSKAAVVVRSDKYGTYVAVAIQVKNLNYPKT